MKKPKKTEKILEVNSADGQEDDAKMIVEVRDERRDLLKYEGVLLVLLMVVAILLTHAFIQNYLKSKPVIPIQQVANMFPASKYAVIGKFPMNLTIGNQPTRMFQSSSWSVDEQVFVQNTFAEGWVEWNVTGVSPEKKRVTLYLTKAGDYGIVQPFINGTAFGKPIDLYSYSVQPTAGIDLGIIEVKDSSLRFKLSVVGKNPKSVAPFYQFGVQGLAFDAVP